MKNTLKKIYYYRSESEYYYLIIEVYILKNDFLLKLKKK